MRESRGNIYDDTLVIIGERKHTFPSRTRSLSSQPPMVVRPRCRARVGCCQSNEPRCPNGCRGSLCMRISARTTAGLSELRMNCKLTIHSADFPSASFGFYTQFLPLLHIVQSGAIHCCQSNEPRCPNGCRGSLCMRMSARTPAGLFEPLAELFPQPYALRKASALLRSVFRHSSCPYCINAIRGNSLLPV